MELDTWLKHIPENLRELNSPLYYNYVIRYAKYAAHIAKKWSVKENSPVLGENLT